MHRWSHPLQDKPPNVFLISCTLQLFSTTISTVCYAQFVTVVMNLLTCPTSSVWSRGSAKLGDVPQRAIRNKNQTNGTSVNSHDTIIAGQVTYMHMHGSVVTKIPRGQRLKMLFRGLLKLIVCNWHQRGRDTLSRKCHATCAAFVGCLKAIPQATGSINEPCDGDSVTCPAHRGSWA